ncbi:peroxiredoxin [Actinoplanes sp. NBRC 14428]|uniref:Alkyl hydroperoxide reductase E n=1 Tax=Pseudosporangium ferrugineum TaxID=439699 RepID=A0A2T0R7B1_9ACTN|nr:peroxiredoxin [Pseudosporangium ferrugineum]PRY17044.1 peroxiredoxin (alkyl hydroperoxide reductase subunit C) [Pseudosporangium ferrugineum]BCJ51285.1 peroxiredoxin [Actinoplanes sp. NBRC 14428]
MPIDVGAQAPDFTLKDQNNQDITLTAFRGRKAVLLVFYPLAFSGTCQGELHEIKTNLPAYANEHLQVLTLSVDSVYSHKVWADREGYDFPLLSDFWPHGAVARSYDVFNEDRGYANRGTFLLDPAGTVRFAEMNLPGERRDQHTWRKKIAEALR